MKHHSVKGKAITLKLMVRAEDAPVETAKFMGHGVCDAISKTSNLTQYTDNADLIYEEVLLLYKKCNFPVTEMRGINIQVTKLENTKACKKGGLLNYIKNITKNGSRLNIINSESKPNIIDKTLECDIALVHNKINVSPEKPQLREPNIQNRVNVTKTIKTLGISRKRRGRPPKNIVIHEKNTAKLDTFINANIRKSSKSTNVILHSGYKKFYYLINYYDF